VVDAEGKKQTRLPAAEKGWAATQLNRNVFEVRVPHERNKTWEWWPLLTSDRHWDNPHSYDKLQKEHLDEAVSRGAAIADAGD
jgi:hypothetical protein